MGDRQAFIDLFDTIAGPLFDDACSDLAEDHAGSVIAQTFVEVWRLARHHADPDADALEWIRQIAARRAAEMRHELALSAGAEPSTGPLSPEVLAQVRAYGAATELARLLGRMSEAVGPQDPEVLVAALIAGLPAPLDDHGDPVRAGSAQRPGPPW